MANTTKRFCIVTNARNSAVIANYCDVMVITKLSDCLAVWRFAHTLALVADRERSYTQSHETDWMDWMDWMATSGSVTDCICGAIGSNRNGVL